MATLDEAVTMVCGSSGLNYLSEPELDAVITMVEGLQQNICAAHIPYRGAMTISQTNTFWSKLCGSLSVPGLQTKMLRVLSVVAHDAVNVPMILGCLQAIGEPLETFLANSTSQLDDKDAPEWEAFRYVLLVFYRAMDYDLSASQVLEFVDRKPQLAIGVLDATLRGAKKPIAELITRSNWQAEVALVVCISKNLYQLSLHSTYFDGGGDSAKDTATTAAAAHHEEFQEFIREVVQGIVSSGIMESTVFLVTDWLSYIRANYTSPLALEVLPWLEVLLSNNLAFVANVISKTDESAVVLRRHVAAETTFVPDAVIPYMNFALDLMEASASNASANPNSQPQFHVGRSVKTVLQLLKLLAFVTHKVKLFRPHIRAQPHLVQRILTQPTLWNSPYQIEFLALCTRLCVNAELEEGTRFMEHVMATCLTPEMKSRIAWRLTGAADDMYPTNTLSEMYPRLESLFDATIATVDDVVEPATGAYDVGRAVKGEVQL